MKRYFSVIVVLLVVSINAFDYFTGHFILKSAITAIRNIDVDEDCKKPYPILTDLNKNLEQQFQGVNRAKRAIYDSIFDNLTLKNSKYFFKLTSYHELMEPDGELNNSDEQLETEFGKVTRFNFTDRYGIISSAYSSSKLINEKVLIVLHGRDTNHDYLWGIDGRNDYMKQMAGVYMDKLKEDITVLSIPIFNGCGQEDSYFGMNILGYDISRIIDLIFSLKAKKTDVKIGIAGISYGGRLSELIGAYSSDVLLILTIGGSVRSTIDEGAFSNSQILVSNELIYKSIFPKKLIVSIGKNDGNLGEKEHNFDLLKKIYVTEESNLIINEFCGYHQSEPQSESLLIDAFFK